MTRAIPVVVWGAALFALGCGSKSTATSGPSQAALDACQQLHQAEGAASSACYGGSAADWKTYVDGTLPCATYAKHVGDGSVTFDSAALPGCLNAIQSAPCEDPSQCEWESVLIGRVADGAPCSDYTVCGPESQCGLRTCNPTCTPLGGAALGQPCVGIGCQQHLACDTTNNVCVAYAPEGGGCGGISALPCAAGLYCAAVETGTTGGGALSGACTPFSTGPCDNDYQCPASQFCYQGNCTLRLGVGAPCGDAQTGCGGFSTCDTASASPTCIHAGLLGEACGICLNGSVCGPAFTCVAAGNVGDDCEANTCSLPLICTGQCTQCPASDAGQP